MAKKKSTVNKAGNYTKPGMRKKILKETNEDSSCSRTKRQNNRS